MVKMDDDMDIYTLSKHQAPPTDGSVSRLYSDTICVTKPPQLNNPTRYYRSTYDFSAPKRYKTVVRLEPTLAPIRYYRTINFGIPKELRHKSTVDCDFRPRARGFSETTWIFPKQGRDIYKSTLERQQLVDMTWYKSKVSYLSAQDSTTSPTESATEKVIMEYSSNDEGVFETEKQNGAYSSSEEGEEHHPTIINNNNNKRTKASIDSIDNDSMSLSSVENDLISP